MHAAPLYSRTLAAALLFAAATIPATRAQGQTVARKATVATVTPYVGYINFGHFAEGPLGTSVSNAAAPIFGATLGIDMAPRITLIGNIGYVSTKLRGTLPLLGGYSFGDSKVLLFDAGVHLKLIDPAARAIGGAPTPQFTPFVEVGLGAIRFDETIGPLSTVATNFAANVGAGVDVSLSPSLALRISAKDYIGKFNFSDAFGNAIGGRVESKVANNFAITAGLTLSF
ncbi:MAG: hypothetical protein ABI910_23900 [Gemmatimonadota bacterium]